MMCRRSEAAARVGREADCLSRACMARIGATEALRATYDLVAAEPVPEHFTALLAKLGPQEGATDGA